MVKAPMPVTLELGICMDGSGSMSAAEFTLMKTGIANAIISSLPKDGSVELCLIQFGTDQNTNPVAQVEVPPTVIDSVATATTVAGTINAISQIGGNTPTADGLLLTWLTMNNYASARQVINVATDGEWNEALVGPPPASWGPWPHNALGDVIYVRTHAAAEGLEEIDAEGVGVSGATLSNMRIYLVHPQPGTIAPPYNPGWVDSVASFAEFEEAMATKFLVIPGQVIPEVPLGTIMVSTAMMIALIGFIALPKLRKK
jgi:hypothetical protein